MTIIVPSTLLLHSLEKVLLAEQLTIPGEALVVQLGMALAALQTLGVPRALQHLQYEPVQDQLVAAAALRYRRCGREIVSNILL